MAAEQAHVFDRQAHWESVYSIKQDAEMSWFQSEPQPSLELVRKFARFQASVIDVGGGSSILASRLAADGYNVTVLDISASAIERAKIRSAELSSNIHWLVTDIIRTPPLGLFDVWHDRAVFHFLTNPSDQWGYAALAAESIRPDGFMIIGAFAIDGPEKCSGLAVQRYSPADLSTRFRSAFDLVESQAVPHTTPWGKQQAFTFAVLRRRTP